MTRKWKVLLIDDDPGIRKVIALALDDAGYEMLTAPDGETGIRLCRTQSPQIVLTDVRMPGIDGIEVLRRIKEMNSDHEVIVITAFNEIEFAIQALQLDASDFITKPVSDEALTVALKRAEERYTTRKELRDYTALIEERWMQTAEELANTFRFQQTLIESSIDGIVACDPEEQIIIFNRSMERMLGYAKEETVRQMQLADCFAPGELDKFFDKLHSDEFGGKNRLFLYETALESKEGAKIPVQLSASVLYREGEELGLVVFFRDLRDIRKMAQQFADQARLLQQDKMIALGKLAASVVHEINNPIAGILNYARLMLKILGRDVTGLREEAAQKFQGYLTLMESELSRCSKIVANLLAFSRKSKLEFGEVNVNELITRSIVLSGHKLTMQNIRIETVLPEGIPAVLGDFNQLQQCLINLIFNAIDAMPEGGKLSLSSSFNPTSRLVELRCKDTGCGIAKEDLNYIFEPFFTTKKEGKGLGLGLSTVYGIIDRHKGTIRVVSEPGEGTEFTVTLPAREL